MKKLLFLVIGSICISANAANFVAMKSKDIQFPAEAYKTTKPTQVGYKFFFYNYFESSDDQEEATPDKNGLYTYANIDLGKKLPSGDFPKTFPSVDEEALKKMLKINTNEVVAKFKAVGKKQQYFCEMTGQMNAQFEVHYEGGNFFRFPSSQVWGKVYSATPIGKSELTCQKVKL